LSITNQDNSGGNLVDASSMPTVTYTVVVTNNGPGAVSGAAVTDALPAGMASFSWSTATTGGAGVTTPSGTGSINDTVKLPPKATVTFTILAMTDAGASGPVTNAANVAVPAGVKDPNTANNTASDQITLSNAADLGIGIVDNTTNNMLAAGQSITFTVTVSNKSAVNVASILVGDALPSDFINPVWSVTLLTGTGTSAHPDSGTGGVSSTVTLGANGSATFVLTATLAPGVSPGTLEVYFAQLTAPFYIILINPGNTSATDIITTL
jgi:uncharacterized repeat protein (TIGR01451 family)